MQVGQHPATALAPPLGVKRPTRAFEEIHQVAATRTERRQTVKVDCFRLADHPGGRHGAVGCPSAVFNDRRPDELSLHGRPCQQWFGDASEPTCIVIADDESKGSRAGGQADPPAPCQTISLQLAFRGERKETLYVFSESLHHSHSLQYNSGDGTTKHAQRRTYTRCFAATLG